MRRWLEPLLAIDLLSVTDSGRNHSTLYIPRSATIVMVETGAIVNLDRSPLPWRNNQFGGYAHQVRSLCVANSKMSRCQLLRGGSPLIFQQKKQRQFHLRATVVLSRSLQELPPRGSWHPKFGLGGVCTGVPTFTEDTKHTSFG